VGSGGSFRAGKFWGSASAPSSSKFYGPVDYTPYLSSDPTGNPGAGSYPSGANQNNNPEILQIITKTNSAKTLSAEKEEVNEAEELAVVDKKKMI